MLKKILLDDKATEKILRGASIAAEAVGKTLGPRGSNVDIERQYGSWTRIHDGVKVLAHICGDNNFLEEPWENAGAKGIYRISKNANDEAGDASTGAAILGHAILAEGIKLTTAGHNSRMLRRGILAAVDVMNKELTRMAIPIKTDEEKEQVATTSAQDEKIGKAIANAVKIAGDQGVVTVDEFGQDLSIDFKEGMQFDQGLINNGWVTDAARGECVLDSPAILVTDYVISDVSQIESFLEEAVGKAKKGQMLILAKDITGSALMFLAQNKIQNQFDLVPVRAPGIGDEQTEYLRDIASLVGAKFVSEKSGDQLNETEVEDLGSADRVTIGEKATILVNGHGAKEDVDARVENIDDQLKRPDLDEYKKERLRERRSKLSGGIAIIHVGNDPERKEQVLDAISTTKGAIAEGIVAGGETAYLRARKAIEELESELTEEEYFGAEVVYRAVEQPFRLLVTNAGDDAGAILDKVITSDKGYNVVTREMSNLIEDGVLDSVKACKAALYHAGQGATGMLTTNVLVGIARNDTKPTVQ